MNINSEKLEKELDQLLKKGINLTNSIQLHAYGEKYKSAIREQLGEEKADTFLKSVPSFVSEYEGWYSESLAVVKQLLPDRLENFRNLYEKPKNRKDLNHENYVIVDLLQGTAMKQMGEVVVSASAAVPKFKQQVSILRACKKRFQSSLFDIRQLVQADLFDSEIDAARELLKHKFLRAAGAVAGVVLEKHLQQICMDHNIIVKRNPGIGALNEALKANTVIDQPQWRNIALLADYRNLCDHNSSSEPTREQVKDLIDGADKVLKTVF